MLSSFICPYPWLHCQHFIQNVVLLTFFIHFHSNSSAMFLSWVIVNVDGSNSARKVSFWSSHRGQLSAEIHLLICSGEHVEIDWPSCFQNISIASYTSFSVLHKDVLVIFARIWSVHSVLHRLHFFSPVLYIPPSCNFKSGTKSIQQKVTFPVVLNLCLKAWNNLISCLNLHVFMRSSSLPVIFSGLL